MKPDFIGPKLNSQTQDTPQSRYVVIMIVKGLYFSRCYLQMHAFLYVDYNNVFNRLPG